MGWRKNVRPGAPGPPRQRVPSRRQRQGGAAERLGKQGRCGQSATAVSGDAEVRRPARRANLPRSRPRSLDCPSSDRKAPRRCQAGHEWRQSTQTAVRQRRAGVCIARLGGSKVLRDRCVKCEQCDPCGRCGRCVMWAHPVRTAARLMPAEATSPTLANRASAPSHALHRSTTSKTTHKGAELEETGEAQDA